MIKAEEIERRRSELLNNPCTKVRFQTKEIALKVMKKINMSRRKQLTGVYLCDLCGSWHHTSNPKEKIVHFRTANASRKTIMK